MTKKDFLHGLNDALDVIPEYMRLRWLADYDELIDDLMEEGKSEEEAVAALEGIDTIAARILAEYVSGTQKEPAAPAAEPQPVRKKIRWRRWLAAIILIPILLTALALALVPGLFQYLRYEVADELDLHEYRHHLNRQEETTDQILYRPITSGQDQQKQPARDQSNTNSDANVQKPVDTAGTREYAYTLEGLPADLTIEWVNGEVHLLPTKGEQIVLTERSKLEIPEEERLVYDLTDSRLVIRQLDGEKKNPTSKTLTVEIPEALYAAMGTVEAELVDADLDARDLLGQKLTVLSVSGDVEMSGSFQTWTIETVSGDIDIYAQSLGDADLTTVSGDIDCKGMTEDTKIETVSGDVEITPFGNDFKVELTGVQSRLENDDGRYQLSKNGTTYTSGTGADTYTVSSLSGSVELTNGR